MGAALEVQTRAIALKSRVSYPSAPAIIRAAGDALDEFPWLLTQLSPSGLIVPDSGSDQTTRLQQAFASGARNILAPPGELIVDGKLSMGGQLTLNGQRGARFRQKQRNITFDFADVSDVAIRDISFIYDIARDIVGNGSFRGDQRSSQYCALWFNGERITVDSCDFEGFNTAIALFGFNVAGNVEISPGSYKKDNRVLNSRFRNVQFGVLYKAQEGVQILEPSGRDISLSTGSTDPEHLIYGTGSATVRSRGTIIDSVSVQNCGSTAVQVKWTDGVTVSNISVINSGLVSLVDCDDFTVTNLVARDAVGIAESIGGVSPPIVIASQDDASAGQTGSRPYSGTVDNVAMSLKAGSASGGIRSLQVNADRVKVTNFKTRINPTANSSEAVVSVSGDRNEVDIEVDTISGFYANTFNVVNRNAAAIVPGLTTLSLKGTGIGYAVVIPSDVTNAPKLRLSYDPMLMQPVVGLINNQPTPKAAIMLDRISTELVLVPTGTTYAPPNVGSATRFILRPDASAWTVNAPAGQTEAATPIGSTMEYLVENATAGALGTGAWNSIFQFKTAFAAPSAGMSAFYAFRFNGTKWQEI